MWVADAEGRPVAGLKADDFEVLHDGEPVAISQFEEVTYRPVQPPESDQEMDPAPIAPAREATPYLVIYLDALHTYPGRGPVIVRGLRTLLESTGVDAGRVLVLRQDRGLSIEAPLGSSRAELEAAFDRLAETGIGDVSATAGDRLALDEVLRAWRESRATEGSLVSGLSAVPPSAGSTPPGSGGEGPRAALGSSRSSSRSSACDIFLGQVQGILDAWVAEQTQLTATTLAHLSKTAALLSGLQGMSHLVYVADGLETRPGSAIVSTIGSLCPGSAPEARITAVGDQLSRELLALTARLNANRITLHAVQGSGLTASVLGGASEEGGLAGDPYGSKSASGYESTLRSSRRIGMEMLARQTGGRALFDSNDLPGQLERVAQSLGNQYFLAYHPPSVDDRRRHEIEVRTRDRSLDSSFRRSWIKSDPGERLADRVEGALSLGIVHNPLGAGLGTASLQEKEDGDYLVPLRVLVPVEGITFVSREQGESAEISVRVLSRQMETFATTTITQRFRLIKPQDAAQSRIALPIDLDLPAGPTVIAVGIRDDSAGVASWIRTSFVVASN